jgi:hypothetical protein
MLNLTMEMTAQLAPVLWGLAFALIVSAGGLFACSEAMSRIRRMASAVARRSLRRFAAGSTALHAPEA